MLEATPADLPVLRNAMNPHRADLAPRLWAVLAAAKANDLRLLPAAGALALYDPESARWADHGGKVAEAVVRVNPIFLGQWLDVLRPVRGKLTSPLAEIFRDKARTGTERTIATNTLADYAADDPTQLANLLMDADPKEYGTLFPVAQTLGDKTVPAFQAELAKTATFVWDERPLDASWATPDSSLVSRIEGGQGKLVERFAFCQTMPLDEFLTTAEALRKSGYRPIRFRRYSEGKSFRAEAVWTRDGRNWRVSSGLTSDEIRQQDERNKKDKFLPVDIAGYISTDKGGKPADNYAALWVKKTGDDDARFYFGMTADEEGEAQDKFKEAKLIPRTLNAMTGSDGRMRYCGVWGRPPGIAIMAQTYQDQFQGNFEQNQAWLSDQLLLDLAVSGSSKPQPTRERIRADLQSAEKKLKTKPDDEDARTKRAIANFRLGENQRALDDFQVVVGKNPEAVSPKQYCVIALARLGKKQDAQSELAKFQEEDAPESAKLCLAAVVAAELGDGADKALEVLEAAIKRQPKDADLRYHATRAFSLASRAISRTNTARGRQLAERSLQLLREAVKNDDADYGKMDEDGDLDPIREDPAFAEIMKAGHPDRRFAAVWTSDASFEATSIYGLDPDSQLRKCRELIASGYRPVSLSVSQTAEGPVVTASVWHRPTVQEDVKDRLAERQARAAVALVRMGKTEEVFPLLRHSADPRLRSFIVNWLNPLGADPKLVAAELDRINPNAKPTTVQGQPLMDAILFHPETSQRRTLILALGTYGTEGLSPGEREPFIGKLLDLYHNDPDGGIHGAAGWTLRKWGQMERLREADAQLIKQKNWGERRWFINGEGQAFAVIEGPVEFHMGSPPTETERTPENEPLRRIKIPRSFAMATTEVTKDQFQRFLKQAKITIDRYQLSPGFLNKFSPDPEGPCIASDWYTAAHYCNWLSEQEGLPKDQWCYIPNESGAYAEGMLIPANVLDRRGYRLPTEPEWEYACRAGAITSRYYGNSVNMLNAYAWYQANSREHAWACGSLLPNDLGLFDMLGNDYEWVQDSTNREMPRTNGISSDVVHDAMPVVEKHPRLLRGGSFFYPQAFVRSAFHVRIAPSYRDGSLGFRPSRTFP